MIRILHLEDERIDAELIALELQRAALDASIKVTDNRKDFEKYLDDFEPQVILSDHNLPAFSSLEALEILQNSGNHIPFLLVTGAVSDEFAAMAIKKGVDDYILKDRLSRLPTAIQVALKNARLEKKQKSIEAKNRLILTLLNNSSDEIYLFDSITYKISYANKGVLKNTGYKSGNIRQCSPADLIKGMDRETFAEILAPLLRKEKKNISLEAEQLRTDGSCYPVEYNFQFTQLEGKYVFLAIARDITQRKKAELKIKQTNQELEQFAYTASHDLKEPLRMINAFVQLLEKKYVQQLDDTAKKYIHFATDASQRMTQLINELLDYSRIGKEDSAYEEVDLNQLVKHVLQLNGAYIEAQKANIIIHPLPAVRAMRIPLRMLFNNLIINALKYHKAGLAPRIEISASEQNQCWQFIIKDNGIGIAKEYQQQIFQMFRRLHQAKTYGGVGMGLAICKKIVEQHGGTIWVESEEGSGSTFCFTIARQSPSALQLS